MIQWYDTTYKNKVLRNGTNWSEIEGFIEDKTRSGKGKRRLSASQSKRQFNVKIRFKFEEQQRFSAWYQNECRYGLYSFGYPRIDEVGHNTSHIREYRFAKGGQPKYSNPSGNLIDCTMVWEEV